MAKKFLLMLMCVFFTGQAFAGKEYIILLPVGMNIKMPVDEKKDWQELYEGALAEGLNTRYSTYYGAVVQKALNKEFRDQAKSGTCDEDLCFQNIAIEFQAELMAQVKVKQIGINYFVTMQVINPFTKQVMDARTERCNRCAPDALLEIMKNMGSGDSVGSRIISSRPVYRPFTPPATKIKPPVTTPTAVEVPKPDEAAGAAANDGSAIEPEMLVIQAGSYKMGCGGLGEIFKACNKSEKPLHRVSIKSFKMAKYEVTFSEFDQCTAAGVCIDADDRGWGRGSRPVVRVSWNDAQTYIQWLNKMTAKHYRLPSEAEWEYAARADSGGNFSWGKKVGENLANCKSCGSQWDNQKTAPVGSFAENKWGLFDMHGNVFEWVEDCKHKSYKGAPTTGGAWTSLGCSARMLRGGGWSSRPRELHSAYRFSHAPHTRAIDIGFRLAEDL